MERALANLMGGRNGQLFNQIRIKLLRDENIKAILHKTTDWKFLFFLSNIEETKNFWSTKKKPITD